MFYQREHTVAYLQRKMPYHYQVYKRVILEAQSRVERLKPMTRTQLADAKPEDKLSVLDFGAGLGSGLWAAAHCYGD